jgi:dynactin complex subunit
LEAMADAEDCKFRVGQRVTTINTEKAARQSGVVKYVGTVQGYEGTWVGVDWDSGHGRHNGTVNGVQYFETTEETSGSLVRPRNLSAGVSLLDALSFRYKTAAPDAAEGA